MLIIIFSLKTRVKRGIIFILISKHLILIENKGYTQYLGITWLSNINIIAKIYI